MTDGICSAEGCNRPTRARGLCSPHYGQLYRSGAVAPHVPRSSVSGVDLDAGFGTCSIHGPDSRLRLTSRKDGSIRAACRKCDRGGPERKPRAPRALPAPKEMRKRLTEIGQSACQICGETEGLVVDHDHQCCPYKQCCPACVRGFLCRDCNIGLGFLRDEVERLLRAADYLQRARPLAGI